MAILLRPIWPNNWADLDTICYPDSECLLDVATLPDQSSLLDRLLQTATQGALRILKTGDRYQTVHRLLQRIRTVEAECVSDLRAHSRHRDLCVPARSDPDRCCLETHVPMD